MSRAKKDAFIMLTAAGSVALVAAGMEIGLPMLAAAGVAVAALATVAKLAEARKNDNNGNHPTSSGSSSPARRSTDRVAV